MKSKIALLLISTAVLMPISTAMASDFDYPDDLVRPPQIWIEFVASVLHGDKVQGYETPIAVYQTMRLDQVMWNCVAAFDEEAVSSLTFERPLYVGPSEHHDSEARALCVLHAVNKLLVGGLVPDAVAPFQAKMTAVGLDIDVPSDAMALTAVEASQTPKTVGHFLAAEMLEAMRNDGWNFDGRLNSTGEVCTANCIIYGDNGAAGYEPVNNPFTPPEEATRW
ncbi:MAG: hypothetical protein ACI8PZ_006799, partial [Myxococcota bacterium]